LSQPVTFGHPAESSLRRLHKPKNLKITEEGKDMKTDAQKKFGMNRTGKDVAPILSKAMINGTEELTLPRCPDGNQDFIADNRIEMMNKAPTVGSIPLPATFKGIVKTGLKMLENSHPEVLVDKMGERLAFERTGVRLYEALISKYKANEAEYASVVSLDRLQELHDEEYQHFLLLQETMKDLGADPTAMTPSANIAAVASMGVVQAVSDPRINFIQSLDAILIAELADHDCWKLLIELTSRAGLDEISEKFEACYQDEQEHLATVREWVTQFGLGTSAKAQQDVA
jgi:hypothetical protein